METEASSSDDGIVSPECPRIVTVHEVAGLSNFAGRLAESWFEPGDSPARIRGGPSVVDPLCEEGAEAVPSTATMSNDRGGSKRFRPRRRSPIWGGF